MSRIARRITIPKEKENFIYLINLPGGDQVLHMKQKGTNPNWERRPVLKCPICRKRLQMVFEVSLKNNCCLFDVNDPAYRVLPRSHVVKCRGCHRWIGVLVLNSMFREMLGLPSPKECHEKISPEEILNRIKTSRPSSHL